MRRLGLILLAIFAVCSAPASAVVFKADSRRLGPRVRSHFLGFSGEFELIRRYVAQRNTGTANPTFVQMARNLDAWGGGMPVLRIGGGSTDSFWFANGINVRGPGDTYTIDYNWLKDIRAYTEASGSPLVLGVNLGRNNPGLAAQWARVVMSWFAPGTVKALEIGNEPDNYFQRPLDESGKMTRRRSYGPAQYLRELYAYTSAMIKETPVPPLAGPATITAYGPWLAAIPRIIANQRRRLSLVTIHDYPLFACGKKVGTKRDVSPRELMAPTAVEGHYAVVRQVVNAARRYHKRVRLTESNSVACGGAQGVSDAYASAVWGVDWLFLMAAAGVEGVDFHTSSSLYQPFAPVTLPDGRRAIVTRPLYYAMLLFAEATAHNARLITSTYTAKKGIPGVHTWATYDAVDRDVRVAIVNKSGRSRRVAVSVPRGRSRGTIKRLTGPSLGATEGVSLGGQSFPEVSFDGVLPGAPRLTQVRRRRGTFTVRMPRYGVALLTVAASG